MKEDLVDRLHVQAGGFQLKELDLVRGPAFGVGGEGCAAGRLATEERPVHGIDCLAPDTDTDAECGVRASRALDLRHQRG